MDKPTYLVLNPIHLEYDNIPKYNKNVFSTFDDKYYWYHTTVVYPYHYKKYIEWLTRKTRLLHS